MSRVLAAILVLASATAFAQSANDPVLAQRRLASVLRQTTKLYEAGDYRGALGRLDLLEGASASDLSVLNLRGAILTKLGDYDAAGSLFREILATDPNYFPAAFNLGELEFIRGNYAEALETFSAMQNRDPRNELLRFKIVLCQLVLGSDDDAGKNAENLIPAGETPAWYYARSLIARKAGNKREAAKLIYAGKAIYGENGCRLFDESIANLKF